MWSSKNAIGNNPGRRRFLALAGVSLAAAALGGCLQPMYSGVAGGQLRENLAAIRIEPIPHRAGHYIANELGFLLNGSGEQVAPRYRLVVTVRERVQSPLIDTITGRATSGTLMVDADYRLFPSGSEDAVVSGTAFTTASYDRTSQRFANLRAARDAEIRAAKALAEQIHTRLAASLAGRS
ncbi:MAG: hypothetical protein FJX29_02035 [Alphaproteobacteria bacterium]|nr:hypothetical protein [Alphaproteobacteria bacterium]